MFSETMAKEFMLCFLSFSFLETKVQSVLMIPSLSSDSEGGNQVNAFEVLWQLEKFILFIRRWVAKVIEKIDVWINTCWTIKVKSPVSVSPLLGDPAVYWIKQAIGPSLPVTRAAIFDYLCWAKQYHSCALFHIILEMKLMSPFCR
jgi:hypothetical protein